MAIGHSTLALADSLLAALGILALSILLLAKLRRALLPGTLACGFCAALACDFALAGLHGARVGLRCRSMLLPLRRLLAAFARIGLVLLLLVVLLFVLAALVLQRIGRSVEAGGQQGAKRDGQQGAVGDGVHGDPSKCSPLWGQAQANCLHGMHYK
jgi:hypothetical protein